MLEPHKLALPSNEHQHIDDDGTSLIQPHTDQPTIKRPLTYLKDYVCSKFTDAHNHSSSGTIYPISNSMSYS